MSYENEKDQASAAHHDVPGSPDGHAPTTAALDLPKTWYYRRIKIGPFQTPFYASPPVQLLIVSVVCFLCPGMFNALTGMGGAGQLDHSAANKANTAVYSTFAIVGFFAGTFTNRLGIKVALSFGGFGYALYVAAFLSYNYNANVGFNIFAGAMLGVCAGLLWCAQGTIMMSYPLEASKGRYISWFWMIFNLGAVIGGLILLGQNMDNKDAGSVSNGTYIAFLVLTFLGGCLAWSLVDAKKVVRSDGSKVILMNNPTWKSEIFGLFEVMKTDSYILLLFPMFFASNWFYVYQFNCVNGDKFGVRARALNTILYYLAQIFGAYTFGYALDLKQVSRPTRAKAAWVVMFCFTMIVWGCGYEWQKDYTRDNIGTIYDWTTNGYVGPMFLYIFYGIFDAAWQTCVYWFIGSLTNNGRKLANFAGFYKGIQSAGAAITWRLDDIKTPFMSQFISNWALLAGSLIIALPVIFFRVKEHTAIEEDLKFTDETIEDVTAKRTDAKEADYTSEKV